MIKTIQNNICTIAVIYLVSGCASSLPEIPLDMPYTQERVENVTVATPDNVAGSDLASEFTLANDNTNKASAASLEFIANDLVDALSYIPGIDPQLTSIQTQSNESIFDNLVINSMMQRGYNLDQWVSGMKMLRLTTSFLEVKKELQPIELTAIMAIDTVLIKRIYLVSDDSVVPKTSLIIRGANPELSSALQY